MNWSRAKSIFIVTFLLLNVFLGIQLLDKIQQVPDIEQSSDIEKRLADNNISLPSKEINIVGAKGVVLEGRWTTFSEAELDTLTGQTATLSQSRELIKSAFDEPIDLSDIPGNDSNETAEQTDYAAFLAQHILHGYDYVFSRREGSYLYFNQQYNQNETFVNEDAPLILELDEEDKVIGYTQRHFTFEENPDERKMITYMEAVETLLNNHFIKRNNSIVEIDFGYYSLAEQTPRFFSPMWEVTVKRNTDEEDDIRIYLVNAILGEQHQWYPDENQAMDGETPELQEPNADEMNEAGSTP
ncbi:hypothetical protein J26TS2_29760 [Shouchella clausii]|uniref:two-component system regulatory protein YycI n=1 Tax=Shouchella tritolerans TaxID=2979466 RepID=UPI000786EC08|nr:two-component system regulatory protein YycI [Shouchella tritolerans]GIN13109.1 hypothetical protein J26TS2_29760 [Shouchella clausii]